MFLCMKSLPLPCLQPFFWFSPTIISILINILKTSSEYYFPNGSLLLSSLVAFIIAFIRRVSLIDLSKLNFAKTSLVNSKWSLSQSHAFCIPVSYFRQWYTRKCGNLADSNCSLWEVCMMIRRLGSLWPQLLSCFAVIPALLFVDCSRPWLGGASF